MDPMSRIRRFDHVGITVADLDTVTAFFVGLGFEVEGTKMFVDGEFLMAVDQLLRQTDLRAASRAALMVPGLRALNLDRAPIGR
jgi:catechol 2,3-dioxygenase-like lactoylglutathione lyase family enzyme